MHPNFSIEIVMEIVLSPCVNNVIDICSERNLSDMEYADEML